MKRYVEVDTKEFPCRVVNYNPFTLGELIKQELKDGSLREKIAKTSYEAHFEDDWEDVFNDSISKVLWYQVADAIIALLSKEVE